MSAGNQQRDVRKGDRALEKDRQHVTFEVIDADQRDAFAEGDPLGRRETDQQRADEPRAARHRDSLDAETITWIEDRAGELYERAGALSLQGRRSVS